MSDFLKAVMAGRDSSIPGEEGRKTVEIFEALYRSQRDRQPIKFPLKPETGRARFARLNRLRKNAPPRTTWE
jgi:hypothetical protein